MRVSNWLRPLAARLSRILTPRTRQRRTFRPRLERLEDRTVPTAVAAPEGLTNWWPADNSPADIAGQGAGVAFGGVGYAPGEVGQAFNFNGNGSGQYVAVTGNSIIQGPRTIEGWVNPNPNPNHGYGIYGLPIITFGFGTSAGDTFGIAGALILGAPSPSGCYGLYVQDVSTESYYVSTATVTPGVWNHVALTYDGQTVRFFINGQAAGQVEDHLNAYPLNIATIGGNTTTTHNENSQDSFSGEIDELSLYNRALSAQEIQSIFQAGPDGKSQFFITSSSPAAGGTVGPPPTDFTLHFSQGVNPSLIQPTNLTVNGVGADSVSSIDAQTLSFHYNISPVTTSGQQTMQFGSLGWSSTFSYIAGLVTTEFNNSAYALPGDETGAWDVAVQPNDGKIILVGDAGSATTGYHFVVARYNANGALDTTFGQNGQVTLNFGSTQEHGSGVTVQPDGKILVAGTTYNSATGLDEFAVARLLPNGALDPGFSSAADNLGPGMVTVGFDGVDISPSSAQIRAQLQGNKILVSDSRCNGSLALARLNSDGSVDNSFGAAGNGRVLIPVGGIYSQADAVVEPTGKIVIADETGRVFRLNSDGSPDNSFSNQTLDFSAYCVILDAQGNILISGRNDEGTFTHQDWVVARLGADGNVDTNFGTGGEAQFSIDSSGHENANSLAVQANGKIIATGEVWPSLVSDSPFFAAARLNADGQLDTSFGSQDSVVLPLDDLGLVAVAPDGGILIPGTIYQPSTIYDFAMMRLPGDPVANADAYTTDQDSTLTKPAAAGVLANDTDSSHAPLTASLVSGPAHAASFTLKPDGSFIYTPAAGYVGPDSFTYQASDSFDSSNVATVSLTVNSLQTALNGLSAGGTLSVQTTSPAQAHDLIAAANALNAATTPASTVVVDLGGQTIQDTTVNVPPQVTLQFVDGTFIGGSPALVVSSGVVVVKNSVFLNATDAPTVLVTGGSLVLRNDTIQESTGYSDPAIALTGTGTVDLGTATDPGGNTINVNGSGTLVHNATSNPIAAVGDAFTVNGAPLAPSSLSGVVWEDFNDDGQVDFGENGIDGVTVTLTGTDFLGNAVNLPPQLTSGGGAYSFLNLLPGTYTLTETQPAGYLQGIDSVGTAGGSLVATDQFSVPLGLGVNGLNYNFGEQPAATGPVQKGQTAGIGFWNNKNGQALIKSLPVVTNADGSVTSVANWLAATLPNMFGASSDNDLTGKSNAYIAALFQQDFVMKGVKVDAQVLATALSVYATNATLDPTKVAAQYGFTVSGDGAGTATVNVGANGDAFGVANNTTLTVMDLLLATDAQAVDGLLYNADQLKRNEANSVYSALNQAGGIG
jgi:uncharacterized delta-60 repeat protein